MMLGYLKEKGLGSLSRLFDFFIPPRCASCRVRVVKPGFLCVRCFGGVQPIAEPFCEVCGIPFPFVDITGESRCGNCLADPPAFSKARSGAHYGGEIKHLILGFKHGGRMDAATPLARFMTSHLRSLGKVDGLVPVPLYWTRLFRRRYNQAHLLALALARIDGNIPVLPDILRRVRATPIQGTMGRKARVRNVAGAFNVLKRNRDRVLNKNLVIIDDVYTTGATANACAKALIQAGAASVYILTVARVVKLDS